eukprot:CAMPEP_0206547722 /NCGR_PEP_ID=MMETSP0325_2-20121206/13465_1 /ASSEMBLY_ACC=CAM_ASM_000347 /TAXON_ID=2866 /ORGANISM="Crypthecodinium cohnii, Strain Seligo" /LENGTH=85 /DNA_ID=CAMNT_0054047081 /DNA_START=1272 /DNA_END=1529 /DNA_ORIENTATION=+
MGGDAEVCKFKDAGGRASYVGGGSQEVTRFKISMYDVELVQVEDAVHDLQGPLQSLLLRDRQRAVLVAVARKMSPKISSLAEFCS